jgi:hypothetical protein
VDTLASITHEAAGGNIESDVTKWRIGLIAKARGELPEAPGIRKIRRQSEGNPD